MIIFYRKIELIAYSLFVMIIISCNYERKIILSNEEPKTRLKGLPLAIQFSKDGFFPEYVDIIDGNLFLFSTANKTGKTYDINTFSLIDSFSLNESQNPFYFQQQFSDNDGYTLQFIDMSLNEIIKYTKKKNGKSLINKSHIPFNYLNRFHTLLTFEDGSIFFAYLGKKSSEGRYLFENNHTHWIPFLSVPNVQKVPKNKLALFNYSKPRINVKKNLIGSSLRNFKTVEFFNENGKLYHSSGFNVPPISINDFLEGTNIIYYNSSYATKNNYYTMCVNDNQQNYADNIGSMEFQIFDWQGEMLEIFKLDRMHLGEFAIDEENQAIYTISFVKEDNEFPIIKYKFQTNEK
ncbi:hypothetical protein [Sphingobacterium sp.]|uniref:hypothetical protein n=1 Tax=Sphingobacterium sp. TaxID=341027 RepID=UPI0028B00938|nr:hypothetical protein [Sphingobacterium sp.]